MGTTGNNKTLSIVLKALGIILILGFIIYVIGCSANLWSAPRIHGLFSYLFAILSSGISLVILGVIYSHKNNLDTTSSKLLKAFKGLFIIGIILIIVDMLAVMGVIPVILGLGGPIRGIFGIVLAIAIYLLYRLKKCSSER